jgi:hypothetical protein
MKEHTPGPWKSTTVHGEGTSLLLVMAEGPTQIARVTGGSFNDARIMAAAPDLLFACQKALCELSDLTFDWDNYESPNIELLRAAIKKAEVGA